MSKATMHVTSDPGRAVVRRSSDTARKVSPLNTLSLVAQNLIHLSGPGLLVVAPLVVLGCNRETPDFGEEEEGESAITTLSVDDTGTASGSDSSASIGGSETGSGSTDGGNGQCMAGQCVTKIDLLFVIDNSGSMGEEQLNLARNFPLLINKLETLQDRDGNPANTDVNIMVTTTDMGNPLCTQFQEHPPELGAPIDTGCNARIERFTGLGADPAMVPETCTIVCPTDVALEGSVLHFWHDENGDLQHNVPDGGTPAQALSCIGPQGINGCGYESTLEAMLRALAPNADWNTGENSFLRSDAVLAIAVVTDEEDCSYQDPTLFTEENAAWETHPEAMNELASSAICWNQGVECADVEGDGVYESCLSKDPTDRLYGLDRYKSYLKDELFEGQGREVVMLGILGVPLVTEHNMDPPYQPTKGGVLDLVYRDWIDGEYPGGDILPAEWDAGRTAAHKQWEFGIGPGCTGTDMDGAFTGQAIPPVRVKEVCESLNRPDDPATSVDDPAIRCCIESICDDDFSAAITCLTGILQETIAPVE